MRQSHPQVEHTGTFAGVKWRSQEEGSKFIIGILSDKVSVKGDAGDDLVQNLDYRFYGSWEPEHPKFGKTFKFTQYVKCEPHSRTGIIEYLKRYTRGIGPATAGILYDCYNTYAIKQLRNDPDAAVTAVNAMAGRRLLCDEVAHDASLALKELSLLEDTRIELANLLAGRGFPGALSEELIRRWGPLAPVRIRRDPLSLLVLGLPGCGFTRCDKLYCDLGLPPGRLKRQLLCLWKALSSDNNGHTWQSLAWCDSQLKRSIAGAAVSLSKAIRLGIKARWLAAHTDDKGGKWIAQFDAAEQEKTVVDAVGAMAAWRLPETCDGDKATPREYDEWLALKASKYTREYYGNGDITPTLADGSVSQMQVSELLSIGRETGTCQFCGRALVSEESLRRGCGPICAERNGVA